MVGVSQSNSLERFIEFLKVFETYGSGYRDDVDYKNYKVRETVSHRSEAIKVLKDIDQVITLCQTQVDELPFSIASSQFDAFLKQLKEGF